MASSQTPIVDRETAEQDFQRFCTAMHLTRRLERKRRDQDTQENLEEARDIFVETIEIGRLVVTEKGEAQFKPESLPDKTITFRLPTGATLMAADQRKEGHSIAKMYAMLADMTGEHPSLFAKLPQYDLDVVQAIALLFFG